MKPPEDMTPQAWVEKCIETTQAADVDSEMQGTLLFALPVFGSLVHPSEFFQYPLLEAIMQKSPFYEHVIQRGIEQGIEQGIERGIEQGIAAAYRQWQKWNARRIEAEAKGEPFNEPPPTPPENGASTN